MTQGSRDRQLLEDALAAGSAGRHKADLEEARLDAKELEKPTAEELEALSADMIGIEDSVHMYLKEIGKAAAVQPAPAKQAASANAATLRRPTASSRWTTRGPAPAC